MGLDLGLERVGWSGKEREFKEKEREREGKRDGKGKLRGLVVWEGAGV